MEKIEIGNQRLDLARLTPEDTNAPAITGGYVLKIDRANDPDDINNFSTPGGGLQSPIIFHDPDGIDIGQNPLQRQWFIKLHDRVSKVCSMGRTRPIR